MATQRNSVMEKEESSYEKIGCSWLGYKNSRRGMDFKIYCVPLFQFFFYVSLYYPDGKNALTYFQVYVEVENCCQALSERLENQRYFFNNK